jgi:uncharacterized protein
MKTVTELPEDVTEDENVFIAMPDGARLAARIWRPAGSDTAPVPAVLEYIPYRKRFGTTVRDAVTHGYLAGHGYACVRVDLRGSGESDGVLRDEYLEQELADGEAVIDWIAKQPWCDGQVAMIGISWGGFNALQIAARRPDALKTIITLSSTDDRYADDIHHMGGCLLGDNLSWASVMLSYNSLPPDPALVGERWREMWMERLENMTPWLETWLTHQRRDDYWRHGSVCEDYSAITCPVFAVGGWADGYSNAVFRLLTHLQAPCLGLIGPWGHRYPHFGAPGPAIGFLQEVLRWLDHWMKAVDTGVMDEPMLRAWMQDSVVPTSQYDHRPGRWVGEDIWPPRTTDMRVFGLDDCRLSDGSPSSRVTEEIVSVLSPLNLGLFAGKWCSYASGPDLAHDQRQEDGGAIVFDSAPLTETLEILGAPVLEIDVSSDRPVALLAARLSDVRPNDEVTRVTYGLLNLAHRDGSDSPSPLEPGRSYRIRLQLNEIAQAFPAGHRIRLSLSSSYWPLAWPPPEPARLTFNLRNARFSLPVHHPSGGAEDRLISFPEPEGAPPPSRTLLRPEEHAWTVQRDLASDASVLEVTNDRGRWRLDEIGLEVDTAGWEWYHSRGNDFASVFGETLWRRALARDDWQIRTETRTTLSSSSRSFRIDAQVDAYELAGDHERRVFCRSWSRRIPRDLV